MRLYAAAERTVDAIDNGTMRVTCGGSNHPIDLGWIGCSGSAQFNEKCDKYNNTGYSYLGEVYGLFFVLI